MAFLQLLEYDHRSLRTIIWHSLKSEHILLRIFFNKSLLVPIFIKIIIFYFAISLDFALNALFFSDSQISDLNQNIALSYLINQFNQLPRVIWSLLITSFIASIVGMFKTPKAKSEEQLNENLKSLDIGRIEWA